MQEYIENDEEWFTDFELGHSKGNPEHNLGFIKQVEMDLSNEPVEDRRNGYSIEHQIPWIATLSKVIWITNQESCQDQESCQSLLWVHRYDAW